MWPRSDGSERLRGESHAPDEAPRRELGRIGAAVAAVFVEREQRERQSAAERVSHARATKMPRDGMGRRRDSSAGPMREDHSCVAAR